MTPEDQAPLTQEEIVELLHFEAAMSPNLAFMLDSARRTLAVAIERLGGSLTVTEAELAAVTADGFRTEVDGSNPAARILSYSAT